VVGKYVQLEDAYKSLREALLHGGLAHNHKTVLEWIEAEDIDSAQRRRRACTAMMGSWFPAASGNAAFRE